MPQFRGSDLGEANFDDRVWFYVDPNTGRRIKFLCETAGRHRRSDGDVRVSERNISPPYDHLLKVWIIETSGRNICKQEKVGRVTAARKLLAAMDGDLYCLSPDSISKLNLSGRPERLQPFLQFCFEKDLVPELKLHRISTRDRSGHANFDKQKSKLPDLRSVITIGSIFYEIFSNVDDEGRVLSGRSICLMDALVVTFALLSLASPNRTTAEVSVLPKQYLQSYSEGDGQCVHFLDWIGSKGFGDYKNHIILALSGPVDKALKFFMHQCEPARIICRFYEDSTLTLEELIGQYEIQAEYLPNLNMQEVPNMFVLGYALGFYRVDETVPVLNSGTNPTESRTFESRPIYSLRNGDVLSGSHNLSARSAALPRLFGYTTMPRFFTARFDTVTVEFAQSSWIKYFKTSHIPEFPVSYSSGESFVRMADAMFCFVGNSLSPESGRGAGSRPFQNSKYSIVPLAAMGFSACRRLAGKYGLSIFEKYGFMAEHEINSHSLRHLSNTLANRSDIPIEVITAWSGRVNPDQTHTYIHSSHEERADSIRAIMNPVVPDAHAIRAISVTELVNLKNVPASITSSGICTQDLNVLPCEYLNDFTSQCFGCAQACYVAGDYEAIELLSKDLAYQSARLDNVAADPRLWSSTAMQRWYLLHSRSAYILNELIDLMKLESVGALITYVGSTSSFVVNIISDNSVRHVACALPDFKIRLAEILHCAHPPMTEQRYPELDSLLKNFGLDL